MGEELALFSYYSLWEKMQKKDFFHKKKNAIIRRKNKNKTKNMKIAFYKAHGGWLDFLIRLRTRGMYCHSELVFSDGFAFSSSQWDGGTRFKKINFNDGKWDLVELDLTKQEEKRVRLFCIKENGQPYDWKAIVLAQVFNFYNDNPHAWFCSEICTAALQKAPLIVGESARMIHPQKLYSLLLKESCVVNRQWLKMKYLKNKEHYFDSFWRVITASFATIILVSISSFFVDHFTSFEAFLAKLF